MSSYEVNVVLKSYTFIFEKIYEKYAGMTQKNMNPKAKKKMLLEEFKILCLHADLRKTKEALKDLDVCYRTAKKLEVEDGISDTGLSFAEFL